MSGDNGDVFAVTETTDGKVRSSSIDFQPAASSAVAFPVAPEMRPSTIRGLSAARVEQAREVIHALGHIEVPGDGIAEIARVLSNVSALSLEMWIAVLNGYISFEQEIVLAFLDRLHRPKWIERICWGLFCISISRDDASEQAPSAAKPPEPQLVPVTIYVDPLTNVVSVQVPDGYQIQETTEARIVNNRLYVETQLSRLR